MLGHAVGVVGQAAGGLQALLGEGADGVEHVHLLILHSLDDQEQRIEPQVVRLHPQVQAALQHVVAVHHALLVVLGDAVGGAQRDDDSIVGRGQIDVADTAAGVGGVDDGLAVGAVVHLDARLNSGHVGGVQRQRHIVEVLLEQLDRPGHQLGAVGLGRPDVDVQIGGSGGDLLGGALEDGRLVIGVHSLADDRGDAVDALADGDEGLGVGIVALVGHGLVVDHVGAVDHDGRRGEDLLGRGSGLGGGSAVSGSSGGLVHVALLPLLVPQVLHQLDGLGGAHDDAPLGQLVLDLALHDGHLAGDDQGAVLDLVVDVELVEELLDGGAGELAGGPGGQHGHAGRVGDQQVHGHLAALDLAGHQEVGQGEVHGQAAGAVLVGAVDGVDAGSDLHGLLGIGEDVLTQAVQGQGLGVGHFGADHDGAVLAGEEAQQGGLQVGVAAGEGGYVDDGGIAEGPVAVLQSGAADLDGVGVGFLDGGGADFQDQVLVAGGLQLLHHVVEGLQAVGADAQQGLGAGGDGAHVGEIVGGSAVDDHVAAGGGLDAGLHGLHVGAAEDQGTAQGLGLGYQGGEVGGSLISAVADVDHFHVHPLADALVIHGGNVLQNLVLLGLIHAVADLDGVQRLADQGLLVAAEDRLAAQGQVAHLVALHGGRGGLGQGGQGLGGHMGALLNGERAGGHLHGEGHAGGVAAVLAVGFGGELKNVKTFQCHGSGPPYIKAATSRAVV